MIFLEILEVELGGCYLVILLSLLSFTLFDFVSIQRNHASTWSCSRPVMHHLGKRMNMTKIIRNQALNDWLQGDESNWEQTRPYTTIICEPTWSWVGRK